MTEVSFIKYHDEYMFQCAGHTQYSQGNDILCSAVSALCLTLLNYLDGANLEGLISNYYSDTHSGFVSAKFNVDDENRIRVLEAVHAICGGFAMLEEGFPDYISAEV